MSDKYLTGIVPDMPNSEYHQQIHIGSSGFKLMARSPLHYWTASAMNPERERREPTRLMLMGTAWHTGIWEPHLFADAYAEKPDISPVSTVGKLLDEALQDYTAFCAKYVPIPDGITKTSKEGKQLLAELEAQGKTGIEAEKYHQAVELVPSLHGKILFSADDLDAIRRMAKAAHDHPVTKVIFSLPGGMAEQSIFAVDPATGAPMRIRPDYAVPPCAMFPNGLIVDGKSNDNSSPAEFARNAWNSEMFFQAAFYSDVFQLHFGTSKPPVFAWMAQERDAPFATAYYSAPSDFVEYGRQRYRALLKLFAECLRTNTWPGYSTSVQDLALPSWAAKAISEVAA